MIQQFSRRVLDVLGNLYGIVGSISRVDAIDVAPPILVHDVSREAEASSGFLAHAVATGTTGGGGVAIFDSVSMDELFATANIANTLQQMGLERHQVSVWVLGTSAIATVASVANLSSVRNGVRWGQLSGTGVVRALMTWNDVSSILESGSTVAPLNIGAVNEFGPMLFPFLMPDDETSAFVATFIDDAGGALTATVYWHLWICPKGTFPPGA